METLIDLASITESDLEKCSVWEYRKDINQREIVFPVHINDISEKDNKVYIMKTGFRAANGNEYIGFCSPQDMSGIDYIQPVIVYNNAHIRFWFDELPKKTEIERLLSVLGLREEELFPVEYVCIGKVDGEIRKGIIKKFEYQGEF